MKMLINKNILLEGLNFVSKALSSRNIIPVLNGIICGFVLRYCCIKNKTVITGTTSHWLYNCFIFIAAISL